ncbi:hypothetical protein H5P28_08265 [Ruficoccus amylovorans]|uniref:Preprotein translocase subunit SecD n=1 Tax=Ruficoccus amylovorans TaxID=1804625 RepID=A0A842HCN6_9BACT|nr:hypothetical protein [Ruficoccus amylovorans]MBC2594255.1 hypothetical protein [Ruficoccus amylovorans]
MSKRSVRRFLLRALLLVPFVFIAACDENVEGAPSFYLEMGNSYNTLDKGMEMSLDKSGLRYTVFAQPIIQPWNVLNAELVKVDSGKLAFRFYFDDEGQRELYRTSVTNMGRMIVTVIDGKPIGARQIDGPMQGGLFYTFTELTDEEAMELLPKMQEAIKKINQMKRD